ncbi:flagellar biosynthetic protein FliO [Agrobacterium tumefaciens]|uniref:flagellar biosynthetic protein FliO n=1 Tax=Agrobacterium tumefaciens TaxID=358 RepID=UPI001571FFB3|nr:flagellar biosynthetic protein FliO [Agrobacterium tumefaciens]NSX90513.1 flagellar biosynthesis protein FliO [Agrobacterium tumefaciens]
MISMMEDFIGTYGNRLIVAVVGVGVALLVLAIALWILRRRSGSAPFIRGGRNRQPRLQVLDATAVDARRRLVLVRRDNVEHLVMIGGPTDIVIESGIGAIPIVREVQEPELKALPRQESEQKRTEPPIPQERRAALPPQQPVPAAAPVSVSQEPARQPQRPEPATAAPRPAQPATTAAPLPPRPSTPSQPQPVSPSVAVREPAPAARQAATERETPRPAPSPAPVVAAAPAAVVLPVVAASLDVASERNEPRRTEPFIPAPVQAPTPVVSPAPAQAKVEEERPTVIAPPVFAAREPVIDQSSAADFLDAARERVLPGLKPEQAAPPAPFPPKPENPLLASNDAEPKFSDELASDFESFLEAEIAKSREADNEPSIAAAPEKQQKNEPVSPPVTGASPDGDVQKEMARIFGELSVTRDR